MPKIPKHPEIKYQLRKYVVGASVEIRHQRWLEIPDSEIRFHLAKQITDQMLDDYIPSEIEKMVDRVDDFRDSISYSVEYYVLRSEDVYKIVMDEVRRYMAAVQPEYVHLER